MAKVRRARIEDAMFIQKILKKYSEEADLILRNMADIYAQIRDYFVLVAGKKPVGVVALHVYWDDLAEIRSFVIEKKYRGAGYGKKMIDMAVKDAKSLGLKSIFALTKIPDFFRRYGFRRIAKKELPHKIWKDCFNCPKFPDCDEHALIFHLKNAK
jgi:amino-acid N-acetyltransferase